MSLSENRLCVFCGGSAKDKTREHVVPYWLLEMTGDPLRVVTFGQDFSKAKKPIRYSWSNFVAPACDVCNGKFSALEDRVKPIVAALQKREKLSVAAYVELLDWLDKVRIGVWLTRHMIEKHPIKITPHFHISSRMATKDRMLALYVFDGGAGINLFGSDSLVFNGMPSCFGFRINNILLFNISTDFFCSEGCGMPHPASMKLLVGGQDDGKMLLEGVAYAANVRHPISDLNLYKPVVWLYQPIKMPNNNPIFQSGYYAHVNSHDSRIAARTLIGNERQGAVFRQYRDRVEILRDPTAEIEFDEVVGDDCAILGDIAASVYDAQLKLFRAIRQKWIEPKKQDKFARAYRAMTIQSTKSLAKMYRAPRRRRRGEG